MAKIKMDEPLISQKITELKSKISDYENSVIKGQVSFQQAFDKLEGQSYDSLMNQVQEKLNNQRNIVAECTVLCEEMKNYAEEMSTAESSACFPQ